MRYVVKVGKLYYSVLGEVDGSEGIWLAMDPYEAEEYGVESAAQDAATHLIARHHLVARVVPRTIVQKRKAKR